MLKCTAYDQPLGNNRHREGTSPSPIEGALSPPGSAAGTLQLADRRASQVSDRYSPSAPTAYAVREASSSAAKAALLRKSTPRSRFTLQRSHASTCAQERTAFETVRKSWSAVQC